MNADKSKFWYQRRRVPTTRGRCCTSLFCMIDRSWSSWRHGALNPADPAVDAGSQLPYKLKNIFPATLETFEVWYSAVWQQWKPQTQMSEMLCCPPAPPLVVFAVETGVKSFEPGERDGKNAAIVVYVMPGIDLRDAPGSILSERVLLGNIPLRVWEERSHPLLLSLLHPLFSLYTCLSLEVPFSLSLHFTVHQQFLV